VFRQKAWLPWWLIPVLALLAALAVLLFMLAPKHVKVPDVVGAKSTFEAEQEVTKAGLKVAPEQKEKVTKDAPPGTVIDQTPDAGEEVEKGDSVTLLVAVGNGKVTVPSIVGKTAGEAEKILRKAKLTLGQAQPQPLDPKGKIASQIPAADEVVKEGAAIDIFFAEKGAGDKGGPDANGGNGGDGGDGGNGGGGGADVTIPAIPDGATTEEFAQTLSDKQLLPESKTVFAEAKVGTPFGTDPPAGETVKAGTTVTVLVSGGFPSLVYDNDKDILRVNGATGSKLDPIATGTGQQKDPTASFDGTQVAYTRDGRVMLASIAKLDQSPTQLTGDDKEFADLSWAPTTDRDVLAMGSVTDTDRDLCFGRITRDGVSPECIPDPDMSVGGAFHWAPDGKSIFAFGVANDQSGFGVVRWKSDQAFSTDPNDWGEGKVVNDSAREAALSPDGKRLAVVARVGNGPFELYLTKPGNVALTNAKSTGIRACKIAWQPDSFALAVVQADELCNEDIGSLVHVPVDQPAKLRDLKVNGDNPVFLPRALGG
jgi:beta-lactam-binding protein with PASTA domain